MFQLNEKEKNELVANCDHLSLLKFSSSLPYVFTEQGVAMLSAVLNSKVAIEVSINIINAFILMRRFISRNSLVFQRMDNIEKKQLIYDQKFDEVFDL